MIDCKYTNEIVCPFCGNEFMDSWEIGEGEDIGELECDECNKKFFASRHITTTYVTIGLCKENKLKHKWNKQGFCERCEAIGE